jgi:hypothetical protein
VSHHRLYEFGSDVLSSLIFLSELSFDMKSSGETKVIPSRKSHAGLIIPMGFVNWKPKKARQDSENQEESEINRADIGTVIRDRKLSEVAAGQE